MSMIGCLAFVLFGVAFGALAFTAKNEDALTVVLILGIGLFFLLVNAAAVALLGWLYRRLRTPDVRSEFGPA